MTEKNVIHPAVRIAMDFVEDNCDRPLSLEVLARHVGISAFHFHRLFRASAGQPLGEFIRRVRLQKGARLLRSTDERVVMVAFECGYQSHEAFSRAFHRWTSLSPIEFRARVQQGEAVTLPEASSFPRPGTGVSQPRVETWQGCWIAYLRHVGSYQLLDEVYGRVFATAGAAGMSWPLQLLGIAYDDPDLTPADQLRFDAGFVIAAPEDCPRGLSLRRIDQTQAVVVTVTGDYEGLVGGYDTIYRDGLALSQQPFCDTPAFLVYRSGGLVDRGQTPVTDIYLPIGD